MSAVYFARVGVYVKIGHASDVNRRMKTLLKGSRLICPDDLDRTLTPSVILVVPFCRIRDERNMQILFARHWVIGEWFRWSPEFRFQMETMQFVTQAVRIKALTRARQELGLTYAPPAKEWHPGGLQTPDFLAWLKAWHDDAQPDALVGAA